MKKIDSVEKYFVGRTPPFLLFEKEYHSLDYVVENHKNDRYYKDHNPACQVAFVGILSYFEAFCKHQFAAAINIFPELALSFSDKRKNLKIDLSTIISFRENTFENLGFILAEKYDFGSASSINSNFRDLLLLTPFSKKRTKIFEEIIYKRNLLVHHAGYYTLQSLNSSQIENSEKDSKVFIDNVSINATIYGQYADFLFQMALTITRETIKSMKKLDEFKSLDQKSSKYRAIEKLGVGYFGVMVPPVSVKQCHFERCFNNTKKCVSRFLKFPFLSFPLLGPTCERSSLSCPIWRRQWCFPQ